MFRRFTILITLVFALLTAPAFANEQGDPDKFLIDVSNQVLEVVLENRESYAETPEVLETALLDTLEPAVDFNAFSRGVMGAYYKDATTQQRDSFITAFKLSLIHI